MTDTNTPFLKKNEKCGTSFLAKMLKRNKQLTSFEKQAQDFDVQEHVAFHKWTTKKNKVPFE